MRHLLFEVYAFLPGLAHDHPTMAVIGLGVAAVAVVLATMTPQRTHRADSDQKATDIND